MGKRHGKAEKGSTRFDVARRLETTGNYAGCSFHVAEIRFICYNHLENQEGGEARPPVMAPHRR